MSLYHFKFYCERLLDNLYYIWYLCIT